MVGFVTDEVVEVAVVEVVVILRVAVLILLALLAATVVIISEVMLKDVVAPIVLLFLVVDDEVPNVVLSTESEAVVILSVLTLTFVLTVAPMAVIVGLLAVALVAD